MMLSCKCLNFVATTSSSNSQPAGSNGGSGSSHLLQRSASISVGSSGGVGPAVAAVAPADAANGGGRAAGAGLVRSAAVPSRINTQLSVDAGDCNGKSTGDDDSNNLINDLMVAFLQKYPRNFVFYSQCMDFFKQSMGPIPDLTINAINQRDLIYSLTLDVSAAPSGGSPTSAGVATPAAAAHSWQLSICINCNLVLCAKRLTPAAPPQFLVNTSLWTTNEDVAQRRLAKSYSDTFGILIMDNPAQNGGATTPTATASSGTAGGPSAFPQFTVGSYTSNAQDARRQRLRQLHLHLQLRLQREVADTNERLERYAEQQFALLESFREKSHQEYELLVRLLQSVPEQQLGEWEDRGPPTLEVSVGSTYAAASRRRNTIGSRRDLNSAANASSATAPTTPVGGQGAAPSFPQLGATAARTPKSSAIPNGVGSYIGGGGGSGLLQMGASAASATATAATTTVLASMNRKMSNFDTPPATPEATPMSVGNSPTFRPQQTSFQQQYPTPTADMADDCLFDLEGIEDDERDAVAPAPHIFAYTHHPPHQMQNVKAPLQQQHFMQRGFSNSNAMSDVDESDDAEEAEDALDLDNSLPIPMQSSSGRNGGHRPTPAQLMPYAQSLPIEIANSPMTADRTYSNANVEEDELDNNVDIAASIKALAKSVHGEAVFGDLPRPRLRSQI